MVDMDSGKIKAVGITQRQEQVEQNDGIEAAA